ncbi:MAG: SHOCT domain-containing protein [bacterium]|uniref:SHOCT domain-containing protein n=1 Tax=Candidatus Methylomirabilis tolerans TaxID=3123416 RepID=A0AAJ1AJI9_9BACT|nr:SHOCT domain-containing protein [Candidatus Methylomirabilis sp.]
MMRWEEMTPEPWFWGWGILWMIMITAFWFLILLVLALTVRWLWRAGSGIRSVQRSEESAIEILKKRYARGEIEKEEFEAKKRDLV